MRRFALISTLAVAGLVAAATSAHAGDRTEFSGCITERADASITLKTSGNETVTVDTSWLKADMADTLTAECVTIMAVTVDGRYVAESVEAGDEPNEVNSITNETTRDRR